MAEIRACRPDDLPAVARLYRAVFRPGARVDAVAAYLEDLLFADPWYDPDIASKVAVGPQGVIGFIGIQPSRMRFAGRDIRVACAGSLMVDPAAADAVAGARLVRAYLDGPQDLSLTESANRVSYTMWRALGGVSLPAYSMDWFLPLRPGAFTISLASHWARSARLAGPIGALADRLFARGGAVPAKAFRLSEEEATAARLFDVLPRLAADVAVAPAFDRDAFAFRFAHAAAKTGWGRFHARLVLARGDAVGCYLYYAPRGGIGRVLQVLARPPHAEAVVGALAAHARAAGCAGLRGRAEPAHLDAVLLRGAFLALRSSTIVKTTDEALLAALRGGEAWLTGLACETWSRLVGDPFEVASHRTLSLTKDSPAVA